MGESKEEETAERKETGLGHFGKFENNLVGERESGSWKDRKCS